MSVGEDEGFSAQEIVTIPHANEAIALHILAWNELRG
jgi:hypothetical protein